MGSGGYAFGDSDLAARRLALVADVLEPATRAFLQRAAPHAPQIALDLGCGPGHSTRLVAEVTGARRAVGLDASAAYVERAAQTSPELEFAQHDATKLPLPRAPADLIFCRLLLAHLRDPVGVVASWRTQLTPHGRLLVDEVEYIETDQPVLEEYERHAVDVVAARGGPMYAGPLLRNASPAESHVVEHLVPEATAARMYAMNLATWRDEPSMTERQGELDDLATDLEEVAKSQTTDVVRWGLCQAVFGPAS